ncbi:MAG: VWA domain-containing protein [Desulfobacteraceae bacterium]|jgi:Ca-activated chloride channel family protein
MRAFSENSKTNALLYIFLILTIASTFQWAGCYKKTVESEPMRASPAYDLAAPMQLSKEVSRAPAFDTEEYDRIRENTFKDALQNPLSTFSIDVDTASYSNLRRFINMSRMPPKDAARIEEMINYFDYDYPEPHGEHPFSIVTEVGPCPWNDRNNLVHIGIQGKRLNYDDLKPANLVFLIDSSGSMRDRNKLPLLKRSFKLLLDELGEQDRIAIVAYAGSAGLVLPPTAAIQKERIISALDKLNAGGSTAGGAGIRLAYEVAGRNLIRNGNNRVILATDGDFNVGVSSTADLVRIIEEKRKLGVYLTIIGFGMGNYKDGRMEQISNAGNGNYFYIDNIREAEKVFVREMRANMFTIAGDVKIQIEFNPTKVAAWRLIGYENRVLAKEDFDDDTKDAGELGAGHTVTALYEIVPPDGRIAASKAAPLKYQETRIKLDAHQSNEMMTVKFRYKPIGHDVSRLIEKMVTDETISIEKTSDDFRFSAAVAGFGMLLRDSEFKGNLAYDDVLRLAIRAKGKDANGDRAEFIQMVKTCKLLAK